MKAESFLNSPILKIAGIIVLLLIGMFLPFMPGGYDALAITISGMIQLFAIVGLMLVPVGIFWLIKRTSYGLAVTAWIVSIIVAFVVSIGAFANDNKALGFITWAVFAYIFFKWRPIRKLNNDRFQYLPLYLICIPLALAIVRFTGIVPAIEFSRNRAIRQSERLIQDIETYYKKNGHYPVSLLSIREDYKPSVIGINRYYYELNGEAYNLYFEQFTRELSSKEIVMYNKLDQHQMTSHNQDLLELDLPALNMQRGYFAVHDLPQPHWKYFWFD